MRGQREEREREGATGMNWVEERERNKREGGELVRKNPLQKSRRRREHRGLCSPLR